MIVFTVANVQFPIVAALSGELLQLFLYGRLICSTRTGVGAPWCARDGIISASYVVRHELR